MNRRTNLKTFLVISAFLLAMGANATGKIIYVDANAPGANNGENWDNAYNCLQDALTDANLAVKPVEIRVAEGTYTPDTSSADPNGSGDRAATFQLINGVTLKGGYAGFGEPDPNARDIELYETILSGDLNGDDGPNFINYLDNSDHIITGSRTEPNTFLDGFTITAGNAFRCDNDSYGGGIYCISNSKPTIINCNIINNRAQGGEGQDFGMSGFAAKGGGIYSTHESHPYIINCTISGNTANGGAGNVGGHGGTACGGGVYGGNLTIENCVISGNTALGGDGGPEYFGFPGSGGWAVGGGISSGPIGSVASTTNCLIINNMATGGEGGYPFGMTGEAFGGGIGVNGSGTTTIINCTMTKNEANMDGLGGGVGVYGHGTTTIANCILWHNIDDLFGCLAVYSCIEDNDAGTGNIHGNPCFADAEDGDYHLKSQAGRWDPNSESWVQDDVTSPCIDAGNPGCPVGDEPAPNGNRRNMGAYGGTAEASKSPANWRNIADLTNDWTVDSNDLKVFVDYWLETGQCIPSDLDRSQSVDFDDFAIFGQQWADTFVIEPGMTYHIDDCNMEAWLNWPMAEEPNQPRFSVWAEGSYIHFEDMMYANCCPDELGLEKEIDGNQITLHEIGYGGLCDCMCYFPITATLGPFEDGTYTVEVFDNYGQPLGVVEVTIGGPNIAYQIEDCDPAASGLFAAEEVDQTRFSAVVEGRYIHFEDMMVANCCPDELGLEMTVEDNLITIYETEYTPGGCFCICDYPVTATLGPFEPGTYILEVYEDWGGFIGSTVVTIDPAR